MTFIRQRDHSSSNEDKTVKTLEAGLKYTKGNTSAALRYNGIRKYPFGSHRPG